MGNRCVITTKMAMKDGKFDDDSKELGVYLHWNGGRDSVKAFLAYCEAQKFRTPHYDSYGWARLCQVVANFFGNEHGGLSIGIDQVCRLDMTSDNGVYIIDGWKIVDRAHYDYKEQDSHDFKEMMLAIDNAQPVGCQIGAENLTKWIEEHPEYKE